MSPFCQAPGAVGAEGASACPPPYRHVVVPPRHKTANVQVSHGEMHGQSPTQVSTLGPQPGRWAKGKGLVSGGCQWRALEAERLPCLLDGQRH